MPKKKDKMTRRGKEILDALQGFLDELMIVVDEDEGDDPRDTAHAAVDRHRNAVAGGAVEIANAIQAHGEVVASAGLRVAEAILDLSRTIRERGNRTGEPGR